MTSMTGLVLLVLLAIEGFTVLSVQQMIKLHIILGLFLIGPVLWKCATTGYRFVRYYRHDEAYVRKGPPPIILRVLGPLVIVSSLAVLGTGVGLIFDHQHGLLLTAHQASFFIWFGAMVIHVLGHIVEAGRNSAAEFHRPALSGRAVRVLGLGVALLAGLGIVLAVYPSASSWTSHRGFDHGHVRFQGQ